MAQETIKCPKCGEIIPLSNAIKVKNNQDEKTYGVYIEERKHLIEATKEGARSFDKAILTLSAGAFGLSLSFVLHFLPNQILVALPFIKYSWLLLGLSIFSTLTSFLTSQWACEKQIEILEKQFLDEKSRSLKGNAFAKITNFLNIFSMLTFIVGLSLLACFGFLNLQNKEMIR